MDIIKQNKIGKWIIILLVILNLIMLSNIWFLNKRPDLPPPPGRKDIVRFLKQELNLNDAQVEKLAELREEHFLVIHNKRSQIMSLKKELMESAFSISQDQSFADSLATAIGKLQTDIEIATFNHFSEVTRICGSEKLPQLKQLLKELLGPPEEERPRLGTPPPPPLQR